MEPEREIARLYLEHAPRIVRALRRSGFGHAQACDATQDAFVRLLERPQDVQQPPAWLRATARNKAARAAHDAPSEDKGDESAALMRMDEALDAGRALDSIGERVHPAVSLAAHGCTSEEIAAECGYASAQTARVILHRERARLRAALGMEAPPCR